MPRRKGKRADKPKGMPEKAKELCRNYGTLAGAAIAVLSAVFGAGRYYERFSCEREFREKEHEYMNEIYSLQEERIRELLRAAGTRGGETDSIRYGNGK